jgi:hypothetical protein
MIGFLRMEHVLNNAPKSKAPFITDAISATHLKRDVLFGRNIRSVIDRLVRTIVLPILHPYVFNCWKFFLEGIWTVGPHKYSSSM